MRIYLVLITLLMQSLSASPLLPSPKNEEFASKIAVVDQRIIYSFHPIKTRTKLKFDDGTATKKQRVAADLRRWKETEQKLRDQYFYISQAERDALNQDLVKYELEYLRENAEYQNLRRKLSKQLKKENRQLLREAATAVAEEQNLGWIVTSDGKLKEGRNGHPPSMDITALVIEWLEKNRNVNAPEGVTINRFPDTHR